MKKMERTVALWLPLFLRKLGFHKPYGTLHSERNTPSPPKEKNPTTITAVKTDMHSADSTAATQ
jgi:hypothetical protein